MNASNAKEYLPLVQALADGKVIQMLEWHDDWVDMVEISTEIPASLYRIKPEPREIWVNRYPDGTEYGRYESERLAEVHSGHGSIQVCYREVIE